MAVTRDLIIDSFHKHLKEHGFEGTSVEDIARDLHISKKTIYVHFDSKDEIYRQVIEREAAAACESIAAELASRPTSREQVEGLIARAFEATRAWWDSSTETNHVRRYHYQVAESAFAEAYTDLFRRYIREGIKRGEFTAKDSEITVRLVAGLVLAGTRMLQHDSDPDLEGCVIEAAIRMLAC
ncbi:MAG: TetR/AcrR family transcriptional regulator [Coriobacteriia bacterium]|jgi:AcrR family transcriptional regulator|nr:TetR/AcrR family transcriptional regulator [Coriobacteriia bacterium]